MCSLRFQILVIFRLSDVTVFCWYYCTAVWLPPSLYHFSKSFVPIQNTYVLIIDVQFSLHHASPHYPKVDCLKYQGIATDENSYDLDSMGRMYCLRANLADRWTCQKPLCTAFITFYGLAFARCSPSNKVEVKFMHNPNRMVHNRNWQRSFASTRYDCVSGQYVLSRILWLLVIKP